MVAASACERSLGTAIRRQLPLVKKLIDASHRHSRHIRQLQAAAIVVSLLIGFAGAAYWASQNQTRLQMAADLYLWHTPLSAQGEGALKPKQEFQDCGRCPRMVVVPAGSFMMGSPAGKGADDEHPRHLVTIARPFAIGKFEVTFDEFDTCAELGGVAPDRTTMVGDAATAQSFR